MGSVLESASRLDLEELRRQLTTEYFGCSDRLLYLPTVGSTNTFAMQLAHERPDEGVVVLTDSQTAGKGRQGRRWVDVPGRNVLTSLLLRPLFPPRLLIMVASLAIVDAIAETCALQASIKWPNDVLIEERKVAGILIETSHDERGQMVAVVGMGVNVNGHIEDVAELDAESASFIGHATTLEAACGHAVSREMLIARLLTNVEQTYLALQQQKTQSNVYHTLDSSVTSQSESPSSRHIWERWRDHVSTLGRAISVRQGDKVLSGVAEDVDGNGELLLRRHSGELISIAWGSIEYPTR